MEIEYVPAGAISKCHSVKVLQELFLLKDCRQQCSAFFQIIYTFLKETCFLYCASAFKTKYENESVPFDLGDVPDTNKYYIIFLYFYSNIHMQLSFITLLDNRFEYLNRIFFPKYKIHIYKTLY